MTAALETIAHDDAVRALVIRGAGKHFQAGADINWLNRLSRQGPEENYTASIVTVRFSKTLNELPKPTIAVIHGACFGGGVGIACCVDVALATPDALFAISEVRHGIAPTPISTHMVNAIGLRQTRRYALTGERFGADEAARIGLVHEVVAAERMEARLAEVLDAIVLGAPGAIAQHQAFRSWEPTGCCSANARSSCWRMRAGCSGSRRRGRKGRRRFARSGGRGGTTQGDGIGGNTPLSPAVRERSRRVSGAGEGLPKDTVTISSLALGRLVSWSANGQGNSGGIKPMRRNSFGDYFAIAALQTINSADSILSGNSSPTSPASNFILWWRRTAGSIFRCSDFPSICSVSGNCTPSSSAACDTNQTGAMKAYMIRERRNGYIGQPPPD